MPADDLATLTARVDNLERGMQRLEQDRTIHSVAHGVTVLAAVIAVIRTDVASIREQMATKDDVAAINARLDALTGNVQAVLDRLGGDR